MKERQTTICLNELDWQMIDELKPVIGEKTLIAVLRYAIRSLHRNFFWRDCPQKSPAGHKQGGLKDD